MVKYNKKYFYIFASAIVLLVTTLISVINRGNPVSLRIVWRIISSSAAVLGVGFILFEKWIWKWKVLHDWFVPQPVLSGKWVGVLLSSYDQTERPFEMEINQTFTRIIVKLQTNESNSRSATASFDIDKDRGLCCLYFTYENTPDTVLRGRSPIHYGTTKLDIVHDRGQVSSLEGEYWTSRETRGSLKLERNQ